MLDPATSTVQQLRAELAALGRVPRDRGRAMAGAFYTSPAYQAFCEEDRLQLERLSKGLRSRGYVPGPLAPDDFEGTIRDIWQYMMRRLGTPPADAASRS
jgi:hypothetical protein